MTIQILCLKKIDNDSESLTGQRLITSRNGMMEVLGKLTQIDIKTPLIRKDFPGGLREEAEIHLTTGDNYKRLRIQLIVYSKGFMKTKNED